MIRKFKSKDTEPVMNIWLDSNINAHPFVPADFWHDNFEYAKEQIPKAETYVYEKNGSVAGFIGLSGNYIEGLFVKKEYRSLGIGTALLSFAKQLKNSLKLNVYCKNKNAFKFYIKNGFSVKEKRSDVPADEYVMIWEKSYGQ